MVTEATLGNIYETKLYGSVEIVNVRGWDDVDVKFLNTGNTLISVEFGNIKKGILKDRFARTVCGVGFIGNGPYNCRDKAYTVWQNMLVRCYERWRNPSLYISYEGCIVDEHWHNYQNFANWYYDNVKRYDAVNFTLDKDLLVFGNKIYSSKRCCLLPVYINTAIQQKTQGFKCLARGLGTSRRRFTASISVFGKRKHIGLYLTQEEASLAYLKEKDRTLKLYADTFKDNISNEAYLKLYNFIEETNGIRIP